MQDHANGRVCEKQVVDVHLSHIVLPGLHENPACFALIEDMVVDEAGFDARRFGRGERGVEDVFSGVDDEWMFADSRRGW